MPRSRQDWPRFRSKSQKENLKRVREATDAAQLAFWAEIVKHFPEVESGDFDPGASFEFDHAINLALLRWLGWNHPEPGLFERFEPNDW